MSVRNKLNVKLLVIETIKMIVIDVIEMKMITDVHVVVVAQENVINLDMMIMNQNQEVICVVHILINQHLKVNVGMNVKGQ